MHIALNELSISDEDDNSTADEDHDNELNTTRTCSNRSSILNTTNIRKTVPIRFISTNARSLAPKIDSMIECFSELDLHFALITESWLKDDQKLKDAVMDLDQGENIAMLTHNRKTRNGRTAGGGIQQIEDLFVRTENQTRKS